MIELDPGRDVNESHLFHIKTSVTLKGWWVQVQFKYLDLDMYSNFNLSGPSTHMRHIMCLPSRQCLHSEVEDGEVSVTCDNCLLIPDEKEHVLLLPPLPLLYYKIVLSH